MPSTTKQPSPPVERERPDSAQTPKLHGTERRKEDRVPADAALAPELPPAENATSDADVVPPPTGKTRRRWIVASVAAAIAITVGIGYYIYALGYESTDDAFVNTHVVQVSSRVPGHVAKVCVKDNQWVNEGELLVELDPADFQARLEAVEAALAAAKATHDSRELGAKVAEITFNAVEIEAVAGVSGANAKVETARAAVATARSSLAQAKAQAAATQAALTQAEADLPAAEARQERAAAFLKRIQALVPEHAASKDTLDEAISAEHVTTADVSAKRATIAAKQAATKQADAAVIAAESGVNQAVAEVTAQLAMVDRAKAQLTAAKSAPQQVAQSRSQSDVAAAEINRVQAEVDQAKLNLSYTKIHAPFSGHVTRKSVESGAYVQTGQPLLAIVEKNVWVTADFKETQLDRMRPGQKATITVDAYPGVKFAAHVDSIQRGSGAFFSLLPPENATGNYVKVVQRVPVKIVFDDPAQLEHYPLGPGMSVVPTVRLTSTKETGEAAAR